MVICGILLIISGFFNLVSATDKENYNVTVDVNNLSINSKAVVDVGVTDKKGNSISNVSISYKINDGSNFSTSSGYGKTGSDGHFKFNCSFKNYLQVYKLLINVEGNEYYNDKSIVKDLNLTVDPVISVKSSKINVYEGEKTKIDIYVFDGKTNTPLSGILKFYYNNKESSLLLNNGYASIDYNSYTIGENLLKLVYIPLNIPGLDNAPQVTKKFKINVKPICDLVITKVSRQGNYYLVTIKNIGNAKSLSSKLKLWYSNKKYKIEKISPLGIGKSKVYKIKFFNYNLHKNYNKYAEINYNKKLIEKNYENNKVKFNSKTYYRYKADLKITNVTKSGSKYIITIKNIGNANAGKFNLLMWYGSKSKVKGAISYSVKNFAKLGKTLPPNASIVLKLSYPKYSKYYKLISVNYDKKILESNYSNNIYKFKV